MDIKRAGQEEFDLMKEEWNLLLGRSRSDTVFLRWEWIHAWWNVFREGKALLILTAREGGRLVGVAPFYIDRAGPWGKRVVKLCSDGLYPDGLDAFAAPELEKEVMQGFWGHLRAHAPGWDILQGDHLQESALLRREGAVFDGYVSESEATARSHHFKLGPDFDGYLLAHPQLKRFALKKKEKRVFEAENVVYKKVEDGASLSKGLGDLFMLHDKRAGDKHIKTAFTSESVKRFHAALAPLFLAAGILRLQLLYHGEEAISAIYAFKYRNKMYVYQSGMDPRWKHLSAGMVQISLLLQQAFAEGLEEFDFLKGDESYKNLWCDAVRGESRLLVYNRSWRGSLALAGRHLKAVVRRGKHALTGVRAPLSPAPTPAA